MRYLTVKREEIENLKINSFLDGRYTKGKVVYDTEYYYNYTDEETCKLFLL